MGKSFIFRTIIGTIVGILLAFGTVYAGPDIYQKILAWANNEMGHTQYQVRTQHRIHTEDEKNLITNDIDLVLADLNSKLDQIGAIQTEGSTLHINGKLNGYQAEIKSGEKKTSEESGSLFAVLINKATNLGNNILKLKSSDGEKLAKELSIENYDQEKLQDEKLTSNYSLEEEMKLTASTINQLKEIQAAEENQVIKDFIQRKIDLLNEILVALQSG